MNEVRALLTIQQSNVSLHIVYTVPPFSALVEKNKYSLIKIVIFENYVF